MTITFCLLGCNKDFSSPVTQEKKPVEISSWRAGAELNNDTVLFSILVGVHVYEKVLLYKYQIPSVIKIDGTMQYQELKDIVQVLSSDEYSDRYVLDTGFHEITFIKKVKVFPEHSGELFCKFSELLITTKDKEFLITQEIVTDKIFF